LQLINRLIFIKLTHSLLK